MNAMHILLITKGSRKIYIQKLFHLHLPLFWTREAIYNLITISLLQYFSKHTQKK